MSSGAVAWRRGVILVGGDEEVEGEERGDVTVGGRVVARGGLVRGTSTKLQ